MTTMQILAYRLDIMLIARAPGVELRAPEIERARAATPAYVDSLTAEQVRLGVLRQDARIDQMAGVWSGAFDFEIRAAEVTPREILVFVRSPEDWVRFVELCARVNLVDAQTGEGITAGKFETA